MERLIEPRPRARKAADWFKSRYALRLKREGFVTRFAGGMCILFSSISMSLAVLGMPTGLGVWIDLLLFLAANALLMVLLGYIISSMLAFLYVPLPRRLTANVLYTGAQSSVVLYFTELGTAISILFGAAYALAALLVGLLFGFLLNLKVHRTAKAALAVSAAVLVAAVPFYAGWPSPAKQPERVDAASQDQAEPLLEPSRIEADNPGEPGGYSVKAFSYGSGQDKHRDEFGKDVDVVTETIDASDYITSWSKLKTWFWGFNEHSLPLNGRVWMPEGEGPFPLVLIVHGNHLMEYFSDGGYAYLGELLASRGIIAVSVDANYMNYSVWSSLPNDDMKIRGWLLLKHLQQIQTLAAQNGTLFTGMVDWDKIGLIGHSRGGQAVAIAADAERWFADDMSLDSIRSIQIQSVVAIAPTDKRVDDKSAQLLDTNYFTIQGAKDADVNNFYGERQYSRVGFSGESDRFKAQLYLAHANHSQFNTDWGTMDERLPGGLLLNREDLMNPEDQREVAKVFISAFLEATLLDHVEYKALFQDYRSGLQWLPPTDYVSRYEGADFVRVIHYDAYNRLIGQTAYEGMVAGEKEKPKDRDGNTKGTAGMSLQWEEPGAVYELELSSVAARELEKVEEGSLVFSLSNLEWDLLQQEKEQEEQPSDADDGAQNRDESPIVDEDAELPPLPSIEVVLTTDSGEELSVELDQFMSVPEPAYTSFLKMGFLEDRIKNNKYRNPVEAVYQTFIIPIELFVSPEGETEEENVPLAPQEISGIQFRFQSERGKVMLDDIGFLPRGGSYVEYRK
ncbi:alpha/beta hydrolase [Paenibacillus sp. 1011MAR3C5]|uniref:alpha/beta hydrolase family protein n=1 Tax=Paenibacillus sp. 1011MAR3C5 TaxID=1675787 RepID=UPI000E6CD7C1|nr:alpha/beta hydrolase [Paenibacillus sp. 1011MAR3C5]RJE89904.1 alpha/beta hydrolase [Paenibacillus sp. 1011MAR3C5]